MDPERAPSSLIALNSLLMVACAMCVYVCVYVCVHALAKLWAAWGDCGQHGECVDPDRAQELGASRIFPPFISPSETGFLCRCDP
eukprot:596076-Pelagomonas_calceolata.AAC.4